jgi:hypothetical protein
MKTKIRYPFVRLHIYLTNILITLLLIAGQNIDAQTTFTSSTTYTVPAGVTSILISCWGAGGGSGGAVAGAKFNASGGGGGGAFSQSAFAVTPGQTLTITVGTGGTAGIGGILGTSGGTGGASSVTNFGGLTVNISANGGGGGGGVALGSNGVTGTAGAAGAAGSGYCIAYAGGAGTVGVIKTNSRGVGGAGGGGAGSSGAGSDGTAGTTGGGGTNSTGGAGAGSGIYSGGNGAGATVTTGNSAGVAGTAPGGGAAGAVASTTAEAGAQGGNGQVIITTLTVPSAPSALVLTPNITFITGSFTAPGTAPTGYLVIRTTSSTAPTTPVLGTTYTAGSSALGGFIVSNGTTTNFTDDGLTGSTQYWYWVYSYNGSGCSIVYSATSLSGNATTLVQPAYIYVHLKSINEENSTDFSFSMTGSSYSKTFSLNDNALANNGTRTSTNSYINVSDEGLSHGTGGDGQLWIVGNAITNPLSTTAIAPAGTVGKVYYRNPGSSQWQTTTITNAKYIDGAYANQFVYSNSSGNVIFYNNGTTTTIYTGTDAQDVSANGGQIAISTGTAIKVYSLSYFPSTTLAAGGTWTTLTTPGSASRLDINVTGTTIAYIGASGSNTVYTIPFAGGTATSLGAVGIGSGAYPDVAYDDNGVIYTSANNATYTDLIYDYSGGVWTAEIPSRALTELTGGAGSLVYSVNLQTGAVQSIYSRQTDSSGNIYWIDDERVKSSSSLNGNGIMIPVTPGTYTLTETLPSSSYDLGRYNIYDPGGSTTGSVSTQTVTFVVTAGEVVFAEYVNESLNPYSLSALTACDTTYYLQTFDASTSSPSRVTPAFGSAAYGTPYSGTAFHYDSTADPQDGYYSIVKIENSTNWFSNTANLNDHTGNGGYFLLVNASYSQDEFYRQRLTNLIVGGNYKVTYYAANINPSPPALITPIVKIGIQDNTGTVIASALSGSIPSPSNPGNGTAAIWYPYTLSFTATSSSTDLFLSNANTGGYGNDLAIDDITIQLLPASTASASGISSCTTGVGTITVSSPTGSGYVYSDGSTYQSSPTFSGLAAGTYNVVTNYTGTPTGCASTATPVQIIPSSSLYAMDNTGIVYSMTTGGAVTALNSTNAPSASTTADAVGYNPTNGLFYYFLQNASGGYTFNSYNPSLTTSSAYTTLASPAAGAGTFYIGGITADGNGYYAIDTKGYLYYYSVSANTWTTVTTKIQDNSGTPVNLTTQISGGEYYGDLTEDIYGDLWILISSATKYGLYEITAPVSTSSVASVTATKAIPYTTTLPSTSWQGMAFDATGNLYISTSGTSAKLYKIPIGSTTTSLVGTISPTTNNISDMTQCSFTNNPLSVVWSYFNASPQNNEVNIDWGIAQASSVKGFYVERSSDSKNWDTLGFAQYINGNFNYTYKDASPMQGINYYRINEVDFDEQSNYSMIRAVEFSNSATISVWPNPATSVLHVQYSSTASNVNVQIFDELGRNVMRSSIYQGNNSIDVSNLSKGIYFLILQEGNKQIFYKKIIKN